MCGIAGLFNFAGARDERASVLAMRDAMSHRGPDDAGICRAADAEFETLGEAIFNMGYTTKFAGGAYSCGRCHTKSQRRCEKTMMDSMQSPVGCQTMLRINSDWMPPTQVLQ